MTRCNIPEEVRGFMRMANPARRPLTRAALVTVLGAAPACATAQVTPAAPPQSAPTVSAIVPARNPIPPEAASAGITRFSFIVYGDTRGRRDGTEVQYEHSLIVDGMLQAVTELANGPDPVKFVLQSGDAVVNGRDARQWNTSFVGLINRLTRDAGVPYFLAPGNHDVTSAAALDDPGRRVGLANYLSAISALIPPDGASRRLTGYPTFALGYGNTFVLAIDSNIAEDSVQFAWARAQLEGLDRRRYPNIVVFFHHPVYSSARHGGPIVERPTAGMRSQWMPLFRKHGVKVTFSGHDHVFEHWVERYRDSSGVARRMDHVISGGGGAPIYSYTGQPDLRSYLAAGRADSVRVEHLVRPGMTAGENPYHFVIVHVDGEQMWLEVRSVDWGAGFAPYRSNRATLRDIPPG